MAFHQLNVLTIGSDNTDASFFFGEENDFPVLLRVALLLHMKQHLINLYSIGCCQQFITMFISFFLFCGKSGPFRGQIAADPCVLIEG